MWAFKCAKYASTYRVSGNLCGKFNRTKRAFFQSPHSTVTYLCACAKGMWKMWGKCLSWTTFIESSQRIMANSCQRQQICHHLLVQDQLSQWRGPHDHQETRVEQHSYSPEVRVSMGKYASIHGLTPAFREFMKRLSHCVPESTARKYRDLYIRELERQRTSGTFSILCVPTLPVKNWGRPLLLGELDSRVCEYIVRLRQAGGVVNTAVVMAAMLGIVLFHDRTLLEENGGHLKL